MKNTEDGIMRLFDEMLKMGLVSNGNLWIETAIAQKNARLSIGVANSSLLAYDRLDRKILTLGNFN